MPKGYVNNKPPVPPDRTGAKKENPKLLVGPFRFAPDVAAILKKRGKGKATSFAEDAIREKEQRESQ
jgi:hypothetical protein